MYATCCNDPANFVDSFGLTDGKTLLVIIGPNIASDAQEGWVDAIVTEGDIQKWVDQAIADFAKLTGKTCEVNLKTFLSSLNEPMDATRLKNILSSDGQSGDADAIAMMFHADARDVSDGTTFRTTIVLFGEWGNSRNGYWGKGTAKDLSEVIPDQKHFAANVDELYITCCHSAFLKATVNGKKIQTILATKLTDNAGIFRATIVTAVGKLCCQQQECCPLEKK